MTTQFIETPRPSTEGRRLVLDTASPDFDLSRDVAIGPWCFSGVERLHEGWEKGFFVDPFPTPDDLDAAAAQIMALFDELVPDLADSLNLRHGRNYDTEFWRLLLFPWLHRLIETTWARWLVVGRFAERYSETRLSVQIFADEPDWQFQTYKDYIFRGPSNREYDVWLSSRVVAAQAPTNWRLVEQPFVPTEPARPPIVKESGRGARLRSFARSLWRRPRFDNVPDVDRRTRLLFSLMLSLVPARAQTRSRPSSVGDVSSSIFPAGYRALLDRLIPITMPASLGRDFTSFEEESRKTRYRRGRVYVGAITWSTERDIFRAAQAAVNGEKVISLQYGCNYGAARVFDFTARLQYECDAFFTWGWKRHGDYPGRFIAMPSPLLSQYIDCHVPVDPHLVFVSTYCYLRFVRAVSLPQPHAYVRYRSDKMKFFDELEHEVKKDVVYRPYHHGDGDLEDLGYVRQWIPDLASFEGPLMPKLVRSRMMVIDNPGTTLYRAIVADIPSVGFWNFNDWPLTPEAEQAFSALEAVGIIHRTPEAAALHINRVWDDVAGWWQSAEVRAARRLWCENYARASTHWRWDWAKTLVRLSMTS